MDSARQKWLDWSTASYRKHRMSKIGEEESPSEKEPLLGETSNIELENVVKKIIRPSANPPILGVTGDTYFETLSPLRNEFGMFNIRRPIYSQSKFIKTFGENIIERKSHQFFDTVVLPKKKKRNCCEIIYSLFPLLSTLKFYNFRHDFPLDLLSGLTTGVLRIPQSMAYALLAHLTPISGLYTAFFSAIIYPIFGGSNHMAAGVQGVVSLLIGGGVLKVFQNISFPNCNFTTETNQPNNIYPSCNDLIDNTRTDIAITITFMVGLFQCLFGICRFGFLTNYLSDPLIGGYTTAAACAVVISQMPKVFGIKTESYIGILNSWKLLVEFFSKIQQTNFSSLIISIICFSILIVFKSISNKFIKIIKVPIPGELLVMISSILFSSLSGAQQKWQYDIVGDITPGFMKPRTPDPKYIFDTLLTGFSTAIVSFAIGYSISKQMALKSDYEIDGNQEVFAFGFMNCVISFFNCFAATASMSASSVHASLGGVSQIANLIASLLLLLAILFIGPLFKTMPECVLSIIILTNLKTILSQFGDLRILWKVSKIDFLLWVVTFLAVIIFDVDLGLGIGVLFALLTIVFRTQWPYVCLLGRIPCTDIYKNINLTRDAQEITGIKIFRFEGSLYFASEEHFRNSIQNKTGLYAMKIINSRKEREKKLLKVKQMLNRSHTIPGSTQKLIDSSIIDLNCKEIHHIIIDFSTCSFIDSVGVRTLIQVVNDYNMANIIVFLANVRAAVLAMLKNSRALYETISIKHIFLSVHDAVLGALEEAQYTNEKNYIIKDAAIKSATRCVSRITSNPDIYQSMKANFN